VVGVGPLTRHRLERDHPQSLPEGPELPNSQPADGRRVCQGRDRLSVTCAREDLFASTKGLRIIRRSRVTNNSAFSPPLSEL